MATWAMVVAVTLSSGLNQALEMARGALPTTMLERPLMMAQTWQLMVKKGDWLGSPAYRARYLQD